MEPTFYTELLDVGEKLQSMQARHHRFINNEQLAMLVAAKSLVHQIQRSLEQETAVAS